MTKSIMIQGAGSNVGKSLLVAGLCRALRARGLSVAPFKPQNMSNNAAVTADGGEIGRAQALQALACGVAPATDMNPVLLKPETETGSQVIVQGVRVATVKARDYAAMKPALMQAVKDSFERLKSTCDIVVVEGAGSPAEINLRAGDIANMGFAQACGVPVVLVGDIDRGGVIAQIVGTQAVLPLEDAAHIKGFIINKFRGDPDLFVDGADAIETRTGWDNLGVLPWFADAVKLPAEDASDIGSVTRDAPYKIVVPQLSRIANFDDLDPLSNDENISVEIIPAGRPLPLDADLIVLPGTKSTIGDLAFLRAQGWDIDIAAHVRRGGAVLGICGGYQMLGQTIADPQGIEGARAEVQGLGLLDVATVMTPQKKVSQVSGQFKSTAAPLSGYEIHIGQTTGPDCARAWLTIDGQDSGARSANGQVFGSYIHGLFTDDGFRQQFLAGIGIQATQQDYSQEVEATLDALARHIEQHLDVDQILALAR